MGLLDVLFGRTKPVQPNLDVLFSVPGAAYTLEAATGLASSGVGAVCFKPAEGGAAARTREEITELLGLEPGGSITVSDDEYGYTWITSRQTTVDVPALVTQLHAVNSTLADAGFGPSLLCTIIGFADTRDGGHRRLGLVYLFKRGTFYPFAPTGTQRRDTELELQVRGELSGELPIEEDLQRWFPIWSAPVP
ncbi:hypothetical protein ABZ863_12995 [Saccharomonospora sp. NPDC046836]|uniref:PspA-associated protein PspAB n=1 Tax=Saccharomonospora sp. NPDC046836 TaxID=3156921 RepID=UPI0033D1C4EB